MKTEFPHAKTLVRFLDRINDRGEAREGYCRFDRNERTVPFPQRMMDAILTKVNSDSLSVYPDQNPLYKKLSSALGVNEQEILLTSGADAALKTIFETYISLNDTVAYLWPTYAMVDVYARMFGARITKFNLDSNIQLDIANIHRRIQQGLKLLILANPNQPSGSIIPDSDLDDIVNLCNEYGTIVVLDQAYIEFSSLRPRTVDIRNKSYLTIVRSFSKAFGLAGARLGYILSAKENIGNLYKVKPFADINILSLAAGEYLIDNQDIVKDYVVEVCAAKRMLVDYFISIGMEVIDSHTNFIHIKPGSNLQGIYDALIVKKYLIRKTGKGLPAVIADCLRITVGSCPQMHKFIEDFKSVLYSAT